MRKKKTSGIIIGIVVGILAYFAFRELPFFQIEPPYIEVTIQESVFEDKFYYNHYSKEEQLVYREVYQGIVDREDTIVVHSADGELVNGILTEILFDFPEIFWIDGSGVSTTYDDSYTTLEPNYIYTKEEISTKQADIELEANRILKGISENSTDYEKIKYIYECLAHEIEYVEEAPDNQNIYSALVNKKTVCAGYAKATQYLLEKMDIYNIYALGEATSEGKTDSHVWNIVRCDGGYYNVDVTWADPVADDASQIELEETSLIYDYLCCSDNTLQQTHARSKDYTYPACNSEQLDYYRLHQMHYDTSDRQVLLNAIYSSINAKQDKLIFRFADATLYEQGRGRIIDELLDTALQHLGRRYGLTTVNNYYKEDPQLNKLTLYWCYE